MFHITLTAGGEHISCIVMLTKPHSTRAGHKPSRVVSNHRLVPMSVPLLAFVDGT